MLDEKEIIKIAKARLEEAEILAASNRYEGAIYLSGYAIELGLKAKICKTLKWSGYPSTRNEFKEYSSFKTHDLDVLLHLSGSEKSVKNTFLAEWSIVATWDPESRYNPIGQVSLNDAQLMISSVKTLMAKL